VTKSEEKRALVKPGSRWDFLIYQFIFYVLFVKENFASFLAFFEFSRLFLKFTSEVVVLHGIHQRIAT
jgi:hypothetical protein